MGIFTSTELDELIAKYKAAYLACSGGKKFKISTGGYEREYEPQDVAVIEETLKKLSQEKLLLQGKSVPYVVSGRPAR